MPASSSNEAVETQTFEQAKKEFIQFAVASGVLRFGEFTTKAGRLSPYFFNTGLLADGEGLMQLGQFYARALLNFEAQSGQRFDMLFGPAYKGITLVAAMSIELARMGRNMPFVYNRKEAKDHGEGGSLVGPALAGRIVIVDDVISAGTSVRQSIEWITQAGASPAAVLISLDRMERGGTAEAPTERSAVQEVQETHGIPVIAGFTLEDLLGFLDAATADSSLAAYRSKVAAYRTRYGVIRRG
jgi:orotate phosphoribosyltransferase